MESRVNIWRSKTSDSSLKQENNERNNNKVQIEENLHFALIQGTDL